MDALGSVGSNRTLGTLLVQTKLLAAIAVGTTFLSRYSVLVPGRLTDGAQLAGELTLLGLVAAVPTGPAQVGHLVVVVASLTLPLALAVTDRTTSLGHAIDFIVGRAGDTFLLGKLRVELADGTLGADALVRVEECSGRAGNALVVHDHLAGVAAEALREGDGGGVQLGPGQSVVHRLKIYRSQGMFIELFIIDISFR